LRPCAPENPGKSSSTGPPEIDQTVQGCPAQEGAQGPSAIVGLQERGFVAAPPEAVAEDIGSEILGLGGGGPPFHEDPLDPATHFVATDLGAGVGVTCQRIEGMTKMLQVPILVSGEMARLQSSKDGLCSLGRFRVKGRSEPVEIVAAGIEKEDAFREALTRLGAGDLVSAEGVMLEVSSDSKLSGPAQFYLQQLEVWKRIPKAEWDGVITLESK